MKLNAVPKFLTPYGAIEFVPVTDTPGHTHRIAVDGALQLLWVPAATRPNRKAARFFMRVHLALKEDKDKYYYADRNEDPPVKKVVGS